jgi:hypothetical protein
MSDKLQHWKYKHGLGPHANGTRQNVQMRHAGGWTRSEGGMIDGEEGIFNNESNGIGLLLYMLLFLPINFVKVYKV